MENESYTGTTDQQTYDISTKLTNNENGVTGLESLSVGPKLSNGHSFAENLVAAADSTRLDSCSDDGDGAAKPPFSATPSPGTCQVKIVLI